MTATLIGYARCSTTKKQTASSGGDWGDLDGKAEALETFEEALGLSVLAPAVEVLGAEVLIEHPVPKHVVGRGQDRGRHGSNRRLRSALGAQAMELRLKIAALLAARRPGALDQAR